jgi:hypothetical protein
MPSTKMHRVLLTYEGRVQRGYSRRKAQLQQLG